MSGNRQNGCIKQLEPLEVTSVAYKMKFV